MKSQGQDSTILSISNNHTNAFPYKTLLVPSDKARYVGYYQNDHGEQWVFIYGKEYGGGLLIGGDLGWDTVVPLGNGAVPINQQVSLSQGEQLWLYSCWMASDGFRQEEEANEVPSNVLALSNASFLWRTPESTLKRHALDGTLKAKKLGNVWVTTTDAMIERYGVPDPKKSVDLAMAKEHHEFRKQDVEELKKRLLED